MTEVLHPDGSDCDYCTYDRMCITVLKPKTALEAECHMDPPPVEVSDDTEKE